METVDVNKAFNKFKPESVVFVVSIDENERPNGMVAGWCMKCSKDPGMFAVSLSKKCNTKNLIRKSHEFVIAVPDKDMIKEVEFFGSTHGDEVDKFNITKIKTEKGVAIKTPLLKDATINLECRLEEIVDTGDHVTFIGKVLACHVNKDKKVLLNMDKVDDKRIFEEF